MTKFLSFIESMPLIFLTICLFLFFWLMFIIQYIYLSYNLKGICKVIFNDDRYLKLPLEPFNSYFLSCLPLVFWREILNIKKGVKFKKLYEKKFYYPINEVQLKKMLTQYPKLFYIQYLILILGMLLVIFGCLIYISEKFFQ